VAPCYDHLNLETPPPLTSRASAVHLKRSLGLASLVLTGIVMVQPTAPMPVFGVVYNTAHGHVVLTVLIALVAMLFTAFSYGYMARAYPSAGSAYTYVTREIHPAPGFLVGWSMLMDYLLNPLICTVWSAKAAMALTQTNGYPFWALGFAVVFTAINLRRIQATARTNALMTAAMGVVIVAMIAAAVRYVVAHGTVSAGTLLRPFYDPQTFSFPAVAAGSSIAVLTYIGFDGISTLAEEVKDPRRNVMRATVLICLITGILSAIEVYAGQIVWPAGRAFADMDTAYVEVAQVAGGRVLAIAVNLTLLLATMGSGAGAQLSGARLLYGMGRDEVLPKSFFGVLNPKLAVPVRNILLIGCLSFGGAMLVSYQLGAELLNFGAFLGFMGVNAAAFMRYFWRGDRKVWPHAVVPILGFLVCAYLWWNLSIPSKIWGIGWSACGIAYGAWRTNGFRRSISFSEPQE
jgi:putrescine importer